MGSVDHQLAWVACFGRKGKDYWSEGKGWGVGAPRRGA